MQEKKKKSVHVHKGNIKNNDNIAIEEFNLTEWPKEKIINPESIEGGGFNDIAAIIDGAVSSHLHKIVDKNCTSFTDFPDFKIAPEIFPIEPQTTNKQETTANEIEHKSTEDLIKATEETPTSDPKKISQDLIDTIKDKAMAEGVIEGKRQAQEEIAQENKNQQLEQDFYQKLSETLEVIAKRPDFNQEIVKITSELVTRIANKLHLILTVDFEKILQEALLDKLKGFYKEGIITLQVNPSKLEFCKQFLQSNKIESKFKDNIDIVSDDALGVDDCRAKVLDTTLEYNMEDLADELAQVLDQLANTKQ